MRRERLTLGSRLVLLVALASVLNAAARPALGVGAASGAKLPRCAPEGYGLEHRFVPLAAQGQKAIRLTAGWVAAKEGLRSCRLRTTIQLTVVGSAGAAVEADWHVNAVLRPWSSVEHTWEWRNWCNTGGDQGDVTVEFSDQSGRAVGQDISDPPACVSADAPSTVADVGTGTRYVKRPGNRIPPHLLTQRIPPLLRPTVVRVKNGWIVSSGYTLVAVYAGTAGNNAAIGRLAILRENEIFGIQYEPPELIDIPKAGALRITRGPRGASRETSAQRGKLHLVSANGTKGVLDLSVDRVRVTARP